MQGRAALAHKIPSPFAVNWRDALLRVRYRNHKSISVAVFPEGDILIQPRVGRLPYSGENIKITLTPKGLFIKELSPNVFSDWAERIINPVGVGYFYKPEARVTAEAPTLGYRNDPHWGSQGNAIKLIIGNGRAGAHPSTRQRHFI